MNEQTEAVPMRDFGATEGTEYSCKPLGSGTYQLTIEFDQPRMFEGRPTMGIRGFYRATMIAGGRKENSYEAKPDLADLLNAIRELEGRCAVVQ